MAKRTWITFLELDETTYNSSPVLHPYVNAILNDIGEDVKILFAADELECMDSIFIVSEDIEDVEEELQDVLNKRNISLIEILESSDGEELQLEASDEEGLQLEAA